MKLQTLPLPALFDPKHAEEWSYRPDHMAIFTEAEVYRRRFSLKATGSDMFRLHLLLIDVQKDFCFPEGTLYVAGRSGRGAIDDSVRMAQFIYRNLPAITNITTTLDTHFAYQIFFPWFWVDEDGNPLSPHTMIRLADDKQSLVNFQPSDGKVIRKNVLPNPAVAAFVCNGNYGWLVKQCLHYCSELEKGGKYTLYLWPPHCLLGSDGHALVGVIQEARMFHAFARTAQSECEVKGGHPLTENYAVGRGEVLTRWDGKPLAQRNVRFMDTLLRADAAVIMGQADSHCVLSSIDDILDNILTKDPALAKKIYIVEDCMSSVVVPGGADFTDNALTAHERFRDHGMHLVKSTDPVESWPDLKLTV